MDNNNGKQRIYIDIEPNLFEALYSVEKIKLITSFKDDFIQGYKKINLYLTFVCGYNIIKMYQKERG